MSNERIFKLASGTLVIRASEKKMALEAVATIGCVSAVVNFPSSNEQDRDYTIKNFSDENAQPLFDWINDNVLTDSGQNIQQLADELKEDEHV
ncbi:hypothetical protein [Maridesulfovibrio ferrireducens]|uniref:hypothetical protein n=1 Tax=Maridesulfovibrio ferrireducens TaxID=246191 RepID=UPI001A1DEDCA|nr:hypothetical protein [Maridesulfovibrio ferrireducens]MBI9113032.1 hypothetical protein [Maridesulfovibrio ferrireducens]